MFNLFDGTDSPKHMYNEWAGVKLIDEKPNESEPTFQDTLTTVFLKHIWNGRNFVVTKIGNDT